MTMVDKKLWLLLLFVTALCSPGGSQELYRLEEDALQLALRQQQLLSEGEEEDLQRYFQESAEEQERALGELKRLWTVHFQNFMLEAEEADEGWSWQNFTISWKCINSTLNMLGLTGGNSMVPFPIPGSNSSIPKLLLLLDAAGKPGPGLLGGNTVLDGAYDECFNYNFTSFCYAGKISPINSTSPFAKVLIWSLGLCVPRGCSAGDVANLLNLTGVVQAQTEDVGCAEHKRSGYGLGACIMIGVCSVFALLVLVGTCVHLVSDRVPEFVEKVASGGGGQVDDNPSINSGEPLEKSPLLAQSAVRRTRGRWNGVSPLEFLTAFSLYKTVPTLLATKQAPGVITSLNGLRVMSMFWVILGHTYFWVFTLVSVRVDNFAALLDVGRRFSMQGVLSAFFAVDSFFFLSGVLVAYLTFRQMSKSKGRFPFVHYYLHRYLRLTPTYAFVLFFAWFLTYHLSYGPRISMTPPYAAQCEQHWWTNLLYINNLYPWNMKDECIGWTWYLANDMQFYIISPLILIPLYHKRFLPLGVVVALIFLVIGFIITSALSAVYDFQANAFSAFAYNYTGKPTEHMTYSDAIYIKPWNRVAPYLVGLGLGFMFYNKVTLEKVGRVARLLVYVCLWCMVIFVMYWLTYGLYFTWHGHFPSTAENNIYITFSRFLWAVCLAVIVFACHNGYGFFVNSFLSAPFWTPLARMTFNAYLLHPVIMTAVYGQLQKTLHYTDITIACYVVMFVVFSYGAAAVVCVTVEFPLGTVEMLLFKLFGTKGRQSQRQQHREVDLSGSVNKSATEA